MLNQEDLKRINYLPVFFKAAAISMGNVLVQTKALNTLTAVMFNWMRPWLSNVFFMGTVRSRANVCWTPVAGHTKGIKRPTRLRPAGFAHCAAAALAASRVSGSHGGRSEQDAVS